MEKSFRAEIDSVTSDWSTHYAKRLIATSREKSLRVSVPPGFPYLYVELGLDRGWVHVIDNEDKFNAKLGV